jgi:hypothetical protein
VLSSIEQAAVDLLGVQPEGRAIRAVERDGAIFMAAHGQEAQEMGGVMEIKTCVLNVVHMAKGQVAVGAEIKGRTLVFVGIQLPSEPIGCDVEAARLALEINPRDRDKGILQVGGKKVQVFVILCFKLHRRALRQRYYLPRHGESP